MTSHIAENSCFDFIVVGAGSAGAVIAARLSEDTQASVLLLEAGPRDILPWIHLPLGFSKTFRNPSVNWMYESDPEPNLFNRRMYWPKGKVLGGSSSINGLIYLRGLQSDYDNWSSLGNTQWSYRHVEPFYRKLEGVHDHLGRPRSPIGPLRLTCANWRTELSEAFIDAAECLTGVPRAEDFVGGDQLGAGYFLHTQHRGLRSSTATAYLSPARSRANLRIVTGAMAQRIEFDGARARRVGFVKGGKTFAAYARHEVVLCGGTINTPQLLQLSGVGPLEVLERAGIKPTHPLAGVGLGLHDHCTVRVTVATDRPRTTLNQVAGDWLGKIQVAWQWATARCGPLTIGAGVAGAFIKTEPQLTEPDAELILVPFKTDKLYKNLTPDAGFQVIVTPLRPKSRGRLEIRSSNPAAIPFMIANYLDAEEDRRILVKALRIARKLLNMPTMIPFVKKELAPGPEYSTDSELLRYAQETASSTQHQVGSCRMGNDPLAVVDEELRVHGVEGLRIADASVMPQVVSANTHAACVMIGERCADFIKRTHRGLFRSPDGKAVADLLIGSDA